jgi:ribokinase
MADKLVLATPRFTSLTVFGGVSYDTVVTVPQFLGSDDKTWGRVIGQFPGGMGANVAATFAALGGDVSLVSAVGRDRAGAASLAILQELNVNTSRVEQRPGSTFETLAMIDGSGEKAMLLMDTPDLVSSANLMIDEPRPGIDAIHVAPGRFAPDLELLAEWHRGGVHVSVDIEPSMIQRGLEYRAWIAAANVLLCGETASRMMSAAPSSKERVRELLTYGPEIVVLTRGRSGAIVGTREGDLFERSGTTVTPVNTTGAGDAFAGTFLFGLSRGWPVALCLAAANYVGGQCTESYGSQDPGLSLDSLSQLPEFSTLLATMNEAQ